MKFFIGILLVASVAFGSPVENEKESSSPRDKRQLIHIVPAPVYLSAVPSVPIAVVAARQGCGMPQVRCEGQTCSTKAVGGTPAVRNEYPWVVQIYSNGQQLCGGSLIDNQYILTAASCLEPSANSRVNPQTVAALRVYLGEYKKDSYEEGPLIERNVSIAYLHAQYKPPTQKESPVYDIAVLKLAAPVVFSVRVQPICLDDGSYRLDTGMFEGIVAGFGRTSYNTLPPNSVMHKSVVNIMSQQECRNQYSQYNYAIRDEEICAGVPIRDSCVSDLGGPLIYRSQGNFYIQSGIASFGISCSGPPAVFTRVSVFKPWIDSVRARENLRVIPYYQPYQVVYAK